MLLEEKEGSQLTDNKGVKKRSTECRLSLNNLEERNVVGRLTTRLK